MLGLLCQVIFLCLASCRLTKPIRKALSDAVGPTSGAQSHHSINLSAWGSQPGQPIGNRIANNAAVLLEPQAKKWQSMLCTECDSHCVP